MSHIAIQLDSKTFWFKSLRNARSVEVRKVVAIGRQVMAYQGISASGAHIVLVGDISGLRKRNRFAHPPAVILGEDLVKGLIALGLLSKNELPLLQQLYRKRQYDRAVRDLEWHYERLELKPNAARIKRLATKYANQRVGAPR